MPRMTGADALVKSLRQHGVDTVFALPGGQLDNLFDAFHRDQGIRIIHSRHEQGVAYMAFGYAKSSNRVGVYAVVPGPGLLNSSAALCTAWGTNSRVLCISGQNALRTIGRGWGELHEIDDQLGMIRHIAKWAERIEHPAHAPLQVDEAFRQLHTGRPRPVVLEMPMDIMGMETDVEFPPAVAGYARPAIDPALIEQAAQLLGQAVNPLIVVGSGAIEGAPGIREIAEMLQAPVLAKRSGKGILDSRHYLSANLPMGHALWAGADAVLAIGTRLKEPLLMWGKDPELKLVRVDIDPVELTRLCVPEVGMVGDARDAVTALACALQKQNRKRTSRKDEMMQLRQATEAQVRATIPPQMAYLDVIREMVPDDGVFVDEITQVGFASWYGFPAYRPRQHVTVGEMGTLGFGFPTALGASVANPHTKVIQISGDGGFMFNVQELSVAVQYQLNVVTIIFNDHKFGNVQRQQDEWFGGRRLCSDLHNPDFAKLAELFGAVGLKAGNPAELRTALRQAMRERGPVIVEVAVRERMPAPWPFIMMPQNRRALCA